MTTVETTDQRQQPRRERRGAHMSTKQLAIAAINGRRVTMKFLRTQPAHEITGYVCGMDDYHVLIASVLPDDMRENGHPISTTLVHKSADVIGLASERSLEQETPQVREALVGLGGSFWTWCERNYSGRSGDSRPTP